MASIITADETDLDPKQLEALSLWIREPNYAAVGRAMGYSRVHARRLVLGAVQQRMAEILPTADEYLVLTIEIIEKRLTWLDGIITGEIIKEDDGYLIIDDKLRAGQLERGYLADLVKLLGLAAPEEHLVAVVPARPLTETERRERVAMELTHQPLLEDDGTADRPDTAGAENGRPVDPTPSK